MTEPEKFMTRWSRRKPALAALSVAVSLLVIAAIAGSALFTARVTRERDRAAAGARGETDAASVRDGKAARDFQPACATPVTMEMRCEIIVSAYSSTTESGSVGELRAR